MGEVVKIDIVIETLCDFVDLFGEVGDLLYQPMVLLVDLCNLLAVFLWFAPYKQTGIVFTLNSNKQGNI